MTALDEINKAKLALTAASNLIDEHTDRISALDAELAALEQAGISNASEHWREQKYLYLIYPMNNGHRRREYIGNDPHKVQAALDSIDRYKQHRRLTRERETAQAALARLVTNCKALIVRRTHSYHYR